MAAGNAEQQLALLSSCLSNLTEIVMVIQAEPIDEPGPRILFVNDAFERLTGYPSAETLGRSPRFLGSEKFRRADLEGDSSGPGATAGHSRTGCQIQEK